MIYNTVTHKHNNIKLRQEHTKYFFNWNKIVSITKLLVLVMAVDIYDLTFLS